MAVDRSGHVVGSEISKSMTEIPNLVRGRLKAQPVAAHPDADVLTAFSERALPETERTQVLAHLAQCAECREVVMLAVPPAQARPTVPVPFQTRWRWPALRWAALTACLVVVGAAVLLREKAPPLALHSEGDVILPETQKPVAASAPKAASEQNESLQITELKRAAPKVSESAKPGPESAETFSQNATVTKTLTLSKPSSDTLVAPKANAYDTVAGATGGMLGTTTAPRDERAAHVAAQAPASPPAPTAAPSGLTNGVQAEHRLVAAQPVAGANRRADTGSTTQAETSVTNAVVSDNAKDLDFPGRAKAAPAPPTAQSSEPAKERALKKESVTAPAASAVAAGGARWTLSDQGQLQRSLDEGKTWDAVPVVESITFRALSVVGLQVWVGGANGVLYHSSDAGTHWTQVKPSSNGVKLTGDIVGLRFDDAQHGQLSTSTSEVWITADAGQSWRKND